MSAYNNWYVITGGPACGKTTLLAALEQLGHKTIPEAARTIIDEGLVKGITPEVLRADEKLFQHDVVRRKVAIEASLSSDIVTILDRGMHDSLAYLRSYAYSIEDWVWQAAQNATYHAVFLLEPLGAYEKDYARTEHEDFHKGIYQLLHDAYVEFGMQPIIIPAVDVAARTKLIIEHIKQEQIV